jgi:sugar-specific transcriptional regulator TrmB
MLEQTSVEHVPTRIHEFLEEFGMTENQIRIYCFLAHTGPQKATTIAKNLKMHKMQVYRDLDVLGRQGIIHLAFVEPKQFAASNIEDLIDERIQQFNSDLEILAAQKKRIVNDWRTCLKQKTHLKIEKFAILQGEKKLKAAVDGLRNRAQQELCCLIPLKTLVKNNLLGHHDKIMMGKVRFQYRVLTKFPEEVIPKCRNVLHRLSQCKNVEVHFTDDELDPFPSFGLIDSEEIVLITDHPKNLDFSSLWTNNKIIVGLIKNYFEKLWANSSDVQTFLSELSNQ